MIANSNMRTILTSSGIDSELVEYISGVCESLSLDDDQDAWDDAICPLLQDFVDDPSDLTKKLRAALAQTSAETPLSSLPTKSEMDAALAVRKAREQEYAVAVQPMQAMPDSLAETEDGEQEEPVPVNTTPADTTASTKPNKKGSKKKKDTPKQAEAVEVLLSREQIEQQGMEDLNDLDAYTAAWLEAVKTGQRWGGRARGGRQLRNTEGSDAILVSNITLAYSGKVLLEGADLKLVRGQRMGLIGNNGVGKTTLLRRIASGTLPGFSRHLKVLYIGQEIAGSEESALECLLQSDDTVERLTRNQTALENELETATDDDARTFLSNELASVIEELEEHSDESAQRARAIEALKTLGFTSALWSLPTSSLSGGWRMRAALAQAIFSPPDVLLLDEPTNHLDLRAVATLEDFLKTYTSGMVVVLVSHDRAFLAAVVTGLIEMAGLKLQAWNNMSYEDYVIAKMDEAKRWENANEALDKKRDQLRQSLQKLESQVRKGDEKKSNQKASVQKKLERIGFDKTAEGKKWKISTMGYRAGSLDAEFMHLRGVKKTMTASERGAGSGGEVPFRARFEDPAPLGGSGEVPLVQLREVTFAYRDADGHSLPPIFENITLSIRLGEKLAIVGDNGAGKSTLLRLLSGKLEPKRGEFQKHSHCRIAQYSQHCIDSLPMHLTALEYMAQRFPEAQPSVLRAHLGSYKVTGDMGVRLIGSLSGGYKARVVFAAETFEPAHLMLFDEPTNHLDLQTVSYLGEAIRECKSAVVVITHNRDLIMEMQPQLLLVENRSIVPFAGSVDEFKYQTRGQSVTHDRSATVTVSMTVARPVQPQGNFL